MRQDGIYATETWQGSDGHGKNLRQRSLDISLRQNAIYAELKQQGIARRP